MTKIGDQIKGLTFAQGVIDSGNLSLKSLREGFAQLPPMGQKAAVDALKQADDPLLAQLAVGLAQTAEPPPPAYTPPAYTSPPAYAPAPRTSGGEGGSRGGGVGRTG
jgi:hypothetical protein